MQSDQPPAYAALSPNAGNQPYYQTPQAVVVVPGQPYSQPAPGQTTVVVVQQHPSVGVNAAAQIMLAGLCNCCDDWETCLCAWFCSPCAIGMNAQRVDVGSCLMCACCWFLFPCCTGAYVRGRIYELSGAPNPGSCTNCCIHCWCSACALAQEGRATYALKDAGISAMTRA